MRRFVSSLALSVLLTLPGVSMAQDAPQQSQQDQSQQLQIQLNLCDISARESRQQSARELAQLSQRVTELTQRATTAEKQVADLKAAQAKAAAEMPAGGGGEKKERP